MLARSLVYATPRRSTAGIPRLPRTPCRLGRAMRRLPGARCRRVAPHHAEIGDGCRRRMGHAGIRPRRSSPCWWRARPGCCCMSTNGGWSTSRRKLADNIGWLDFTHMLTFAEAAVSATRQRSSALARRAAAACLLHRPQCRLRRRRPGHARLRCRRHRRVHRRAQKRIVRPWPRPLHHLGASDQDACWPARR